MAKKKRKNRVTPILSCGIIETDDSITMAPPVAETSQSEKQDINDCTCNTKPVSGWMCLLCCTSCCGCIEPTPCPVHPNVKRKKDKKEQKDKKEKRKARKKDKKKARKKDKKENQKEIEKETVQKQSLMKRIRHMLFKKKTTNQKAAAKQAPVTSLSAELIKAANESPLGADGESKASDQNVIPDEKEEDIDWEIENMIKDMLNEITKQYERELIEDADREIENMVKDMLNEIIEQYEWELIENADREIETMIEDMLNEITNQYERELIEDADREIENMVKDILNEITKQYERELIEEADLEIENMIKGMLNEIKEAYEEELIEDANLEIENMVDDILNKIIKQSKGELTEEADLEIENMVKDMLNEIIEQYERELTEEADLEMENMVDEILGKVVEQYDEILPKFKAIDYSPKVSGENQTNNKAKVSGQKQMTDKGIKQTKTEKPSIFALKNQLNAEIIAAFAKKQAQRSATEGSGNNDQTSTTSKANEKGQVQPSENAENTREAQDKVTGQDDDYDPEMDIYDKYVPEVVNMIHKIRKITEREQLSEKKDEFLPEEEMDQRLRKIKRLILTEGRGTYWELVKLSKKPETRNHQQNLEAVLPNYKDNDIMKLARAMNSGRYKGRLHREFEAWRQAKAEEELRKQQQNHLANIHRKLFDDEEEMAFSDEEEIKREIAEEAKRKQSQKSDQERLHGLFNKFFDDDEDDEEFSDSEEPSDTEKSAEPADKKKPNKNAPNQPDPFKKYLPTGEIIELFWPYNLNRDRVIRKEKKWKIDVRASDSKLQDKDFKKVIRQSRKFGLNQSFLNANKSRNAVETQKTVLDTCQDLDGVISYRNKPTLSTVKHHEESNFDAEGFSSPEAPVKETNKDSGVKLSWFKRFTNWFRFGRSSKKERKK